MRTPLLLLLTVTCALAEDSDSRRKKVPYIADAVGNTLPPPSNGPATVGSPVNLLTPDRYEFYTFDESGELVKRLMTLEEIQAIVAAGEDGEGLVTFANDNQPTIAFNFSQPSHTKVHSVVTNVQNVLKAQMEAHKNKPFVQPTLDTPDVSDSWSLILPSIFGNTGVDITPEKTGSFTTPETELKEIEQPLENSLSKEGNNPLINNSTNTQNLEVSEKTSTTTEIKPSSTTTSTTKITTTTTTTTPMPSTTTVITTTQKPSTSTTRKIGTTTKPSTIRAKLTTTTTHQPSTTSRLTTSKPTSTISTTTRPRFTTSSRPRTTTTTTTKPRTTTTTTTTTVKPQTTITTSSPLTKPVVRTTSTAQTTPKVTTIRPYFTTRKRPTLTTQNNNEDNFTRIKIQTVAYAPSTTVKSTNTVNYEKISTFIPVSTATYITEGTTRSPAPSPTTFFSSTTKRSVSSTTSAPSMSTQKSKPSTTLASTTTPYISTSTSNEEKINATTVTTQSVSPSTTATSTEFITTSQTSNKQEDEFSFNDAQPDFPVFDVAQSISQIASDLGNDRPLPTSNELLLDTTKFSEMNMESKENVEIDIPSDIEKVNVTKQSVTEKDQDNFVKISTIDPHFNKAPVTKETLTLSENDIPFITTQRAEATSEIPTTSTLDTFLSESMGDLLSQVVNQVPHAIIDKDKQFEKDITTTEKNIETTTDQNRLSTMSETQKDNEITTKLPVTSAHVTTQVMETKEIENSTEIKSTTTFEPVTDQSTTKVIMQSEKTEDNSENYVQISISQDNDTKNHIIKTTTVTPTTVAPPTEAQKADEQKLNIDKKEKPPVKNLDSPIESEKVNLIPLNLKENQKQAEKNENKMEPVSNFLTLETRIKEENKTIIQTTQAPVMSPDSNKLENKNEKEKIIDLPKIEEFKKKIQKVNIDEKELANERNSSWKPVSTVAPPKTTETQKDKIKVDQTNNNKDINLEFSKENQGLEITTKDLDEDVAQFTELCNELAFKYWHALTQSVDKKRSFVLSPYSITSMLSMIFMGARGATSGEMNEILKLDDMVTFNPHFTLKNISDSLEMSPVSGVLVSAFVRELFSDRNKGKILTFYKERASHFYNGHVEEVNFNLISDIIRRRTNLLVKRYTWGKIMEYMKANTLTMQPPFAAFSVNVFQTDCSETSVEGGRDGEMYFVVSPNVRQRRLVPVPAVVYKEGFLAGYDPVLDATAAAIGGSVVSTLFVMPGQQGNIVHAEDLEELEKRLLESNPTTSAWKRLLRTLLPRMGLELQIPRFSHKSIFNVSSTLKQMGLKDLFDAEHADLGGVIGPSKDLYLSDMIQSTTFVTCGGGVIGEQHHVEEYPESLKEIQRRRQARWTTMWEEPRDYQRAFHDPNDMSDAMNLPLHLRPRQARVPARAAQPARLKFDRPFLYFVRHNPTGMILYVGRYNPRLLP